MVFFGGCILPPCTTSFKIRSALALCYISRITAREHPPSFMVIEMTKCENVNRGVRDTEG